MIPRTEVTGRMQPALRRPVKSSIILVSLASLSILSSGCSESPERDYSLPKTLCGLKLEKRGYDSLFGPGSEISREDFKRWGRDDTSSEGCGYYVNGDDSVLVKGNWRSTGSPAFPWQPMKVIKRHKTAAATPKKAPGAYTAATWKHGAVAATTCDGAKSGNRYMLEILVVKHEIGSEGDAHKIFGPLIQKAMTEVKKRLPCEKS